jgi:hypothetical protein
MFAKSLKENVGVPFLAACNVCCYLKSMMVPAEAGNQVPQTYIIFRRKRCPRNPDRVS